MAQTTVPDQEVVLLAAIPLDSLPALRTLRKRWPAQSALLFVRLDGGVVYNSELTDPTRLGRRRDFEELRSLERCGFCDIVELTPNESYTARPVVRAAARSQLLPWLLLLEVPAAEFIAPFERLTTQRIGLMALATLASLVIAFGVSARLGRQIEQLTADTQAIADGDPERRATVDSRDEVGRLAGSINRMTDALIERQTKLREAQVQKEHAARLEALGTFASMIAHDFNNYLHSIMSHAFLIERSLADGDPLLQDVEQISGTANRASTLTRRILDFARLKGPDVALVHAPTLVEELRPVLTSLLGVTHSLAIEVPSRTDSDRERWTIPLAPSALEQILVNLVVNARDAMPTGGMVQLRLRAGAPDPSTDESDDVIIEVEDQGIGMSSQVQERIFEPFFTTKPSPVGSGLGLAIVAAAVRSAGGLIRLRSTEGVGTEIQLRFPRADRALTADTEHAGEDELRLPVPGNLRALIVDDDLDSAVVTGRLLAFAGIATVHASSSHDAMDHFRTQGSFDVLVTDIQMPDITGLELAQRLRSTDPELAVVYLTGATFDDPTAFGDDPVLPKPCSWWRLVVAVQDARRRIHSAP